MVITMTVKSTPGYLRAIECALIIDITNLVPFTRDDSPSRNFFARPETFSSQLFPDVKSGP